MYVRSSTHSYVSNAPAEHKLAATGEETSPDSEQQKLIEGLQGVYSRPNGTSLYKPSVQ